MIYTIENEYITACISDLGATLVKLIDKKSGTDLVLGFEDEKDYLLNSGANIGASVGRNANRIGNAEFVLNGTGYHLTKNDNNNQLHGGGDKGFAFKRWTKESLSETEIVLSYYSKDGEEGFPGNMKVSVSYQLRNNTLTWAYSGISDEDTVFNMTNHSYICLGDDNILNQELRIYTDRYSPVDEYSLTKDEVLPVKDTAFDFTDYRRIGDNLSMTEKGIDNNYVWENMDEKLQASLRNDRIQLDVYSDLPDMHLYTAYYLSAKNGKYGKDYDKYSALCLESQFYPNGINYKDYIKPILKKNKAVSHYIRYEIKER
ncbi:MAG: aldose epimerase family protein [Erysipelotrichaceae bacterium]|nr:aldose epimerase family protein [Erysipelotrichaceae bacterium]